MIEGYFIKGTTFNWVPPTALTPPNQDGSLVQSGHNPGPAMTFKGLDHEILYGAMQTPASLGMNANFSIPYVWLNFIHGQTAYIQPAGADVLTGFMSGCWICAWTQGGHRRVGHVGTIETAPPNQPPNTTVKAAFINNVANAVGPAGNLTGYNPFGMWDIWEIKKVARESKHSGMLDARVISLVTSNNEFYSILMFKDMRVGPQGAPQNLYVCGGKKRANASNHAAVVQALQ
jgi:hypothetical protein